MVQKMDRRQFCQTGALTAAALGLSEHSFLGGLPRVEAAELKATRQPLRLQGSLEPTVRLLMETPREKIIEVFAQRVKDGLTYREVLGSLLLAGVTNIEPRPEVGFKFHAVLVVNSAHLASLASPPEHRWLPIFWALDHYKDSEADDVKERGDWRMSEVDEAAVPSASQARGAFIAALDKWDEAAADAAIAGLARSAAPAEIAEIFFRYGSRDFRSIGHKAIFVANSFRTLQYIGWDYAEPILRSLAYALLKHEGTNPSKSDDPADRPYRLNLERLKSLKPIAKEGKRDDKATELLLATLHGGSEDDACEQVIEQLNAGVSAQSVWDALHVGATELMMRQPGIVALHAVTTTNAIHVAFRETADEETRRLLILQNAAFLPMFRSAMKRRGSMSDKSVLELEKTPTDKPGTAEEILRGSRRDAMVASRQALAFLTSGGKQSDLIDAARLLVYFKGDDAHDYKFSSAILEDCQNVSPRWSDLYLAANVVKLPSPQDRDNSLVQRTQAAFS